jgi:hypothetical protein
MTIENVPSENPKTGLITALSVIGLLRNTKAALQLEPDATDRVNWPIEQPALRDKPSTQSSRIAQNAISIGAGAERSASTT